MRYVLVILLCLPGLLLQAQGDAVISQYVFQPFLFNPAAAGSDGGLSVGVVYRNQWGGLEGAPQSYQLQASNLFAQQRIGVGVNAARDSWGPYKQHQFFGAFSYRIPLGKGEYKKSYLALGLQAGIQQFNTNWGDLTAFQAGDVTFTGNPGNNVLIPNFGAGLLYKNEKLTAGFSVPHLLSGSVFGEKYLTLTNYYTAHFDYRLKLSEKVGLMPATLIKWTSNNAQVDLNLYLILMEKFWLGTAFRSDKSANFSAQYHLIKDKHNLRVIYSYDLANGTYRDVTGSGTHEISLVYFIKSGPLTPPFAPSDTPKEKKSKDKKEADK